MISSCESEESPCFRRISTWLEFVRNNPFQRIRYFTALRASNSAEMGVRIRTGNGSSSGPPTHLGTHFRQKLESHRFHQKNLLSEVHPETRQARGREHPLCPEARTHSGRANEGRGRTLLWNCRGPSSAPGGPAPFGVWAFSSFGLF